MDDTMKPQLITPVDRERAYRVRTAPTASGAEGRFDLFIHERGDDGELLETFADLTLEPADPRYAPKVVNARSGLVRMEDLGHG